MNAPFGDNIYKAADLHSQYAVDMRHDMAPSHPIVNYDLLAITVIPGCCKYKI